ncbi:uracil-DNA glycosylase [Thioclava sp. SK-1]|uniref:uracil-DNA glycosylase n=1 Tax=Thioclava sp. SK-1 TaxID=1889770 RepID=UPI000823FED3|nr:uracil-DNA glycosylase [Thioclava sp. SK-1]OCX66984.1 uracil-DNA glycosylase [Thioclava sp. SK-1]
MDETLPPNSDAAPNAEPWQQLDYASAVAAFEWLMELGACDPVSDAPVIRYDLPDKLARSAAALPQQGAPTAADRAQAPLTHPRVTPAQAPGTDEGIGVARAQAGAVETLEALRDAIDAFHHCDLRKGARSMVFADGRAGARVLIIGEAPGRDEDRDGRPFVGSAGQLLDNMLAAIGLSRSNPDVESSVYLLPALPWRPPQDRDPTAAELALMQPFLARHIALADPDVIVLMGNAACAAGLGRAGLSRLRGIWTEAFGKPALPMQHPVHLMRQPAAKRDAWADLLALKVRLQQG